MSFDIGRRLLLERTLNLLVATTVWAVGYVAGNVAAIVTLEGLQAHPTQG